MEEQEVFCAVVGYEGKYEVSNFGRVRSLNYHRENREHILTGAVDRYGYQKVTFCLKAKQSTHLVHRLVACAFLTPATTADATTVNHIDGNKRNNHWRNLEWLSSPDNVRHAHSIGISDSKGESSGMAKLTDDMVMQIREGYKSMSIKDLAEKFNISESTIHKVASGLTWKHLPLVDYSERKRKIFAPVEGFIEAAIAIHGAEQYDYSQVEYVNSRTPVSIICFTHGPFSQKPKGHIVGQGCPRCAVLKRKATLLNKEAA